MSDADRKNPDSPQVRALAAASDAATLAMTNPTPANVAAWRAADAAYRATYAPES